MPTSSEILQVILEYIYTDESPTIKGSFSSVMLSAKTFCYVYDVLFLSTCFTKFTSVVKGNILTVLALVLFYCVTESLNVEFVCNVLVVADQLLITRLKEMCEVVITENCMFYLFYPSTPFSNFILFFCFALNVLPAAFTMLHSWQIL